MKIKPTPYYLFFSLILITFLSTSFAQQKQTGSPSNEKNFKIHKVEKGQSLYAIAKLYKIEINSIIMENPSAIDGIKTGQELKIPLTKQAPGKEISTENYSEQTINGTHKVIKGETIYAICKKYNLSQEQIISLNPTLKDGLKEGQLLKVKDTEIKKTENIISTSKNTTISNTSANNTRPEIYQVKEEDDLVSILKMSGMTEKEFYDLNPEAKQGIRKNQLLKINTSLPLNTINKNNIDTTKQKVKASESNLPKTPVKNNEAVTSNVIDTSLLVKKNNYKIGLMLPFKFDETNFIEVNKLAEQKQNFPEQQNISIDFYEGINYAFQSLNTSNNSIQLELFDISERDSSKVIDILQQKKFKDLDLCIGPVYNSMFKLVADQCKSSNTPIVSPFTQQNKILFENQHASKTTPSNVTLIESLAEFIVDSMEKANVIVINSGKSKEQTLIKSFKTKYNDYIKENKRPITDTVLEIKSGNFEKVNFSSARKNYFIIISEDELYLTDLLTRLSRSFNDKNDNNIAIGLKKWTELENIDSDYLNRLHFIYPSPNYIDISNPEITKAIEYYQKNYNTDPSDYYFQGIDLGLFYAKQLNKYGKGFYQFLDKINESGLTMDFNFFRPSTKTGFDNKSLKLIQYQDYKFVKIH
jgi:LysM repeat protein